MTADRDAIDGEVVGENSREQREVVHHQGGGAVTEHHGSQAPAVFNPLDAPSAAFRQEVEKRQQNYDMLREFLLSKMRRGYDYGPLHVGYGSKNCRHKWNPKACQDPAHWSQDQLFDAGAETVLTLLGLRVDYEGERGYRQSTLQGIPILDVIITAEVLDHHGAKLSKATGSENVEKAGTLHNALQKAHKRARVQAVRALPTVRSLFKDLTTTPTADDLDASQRHRPAEARRHDSRPSAATGRIPTELPFKIGNTSKGTPIAQCDGKLLAWILEKMPHKPDLAQAARMELDRRRLQEPDMRPAPEPDSRADGTTFDEGPSADDYFR